MPPVTVGIGVLLIVLGLGGYFGTGQDHPTALIPAYFGAALLVLGLLGFKNGLRKHVMHLAAMVGTIGLIGALVMVALALIHVARDGAFARPVAFACQVIMAGLCGVFVYLCVRSFVAARRARAAYPPSVPERSSSPR